MNLSRYYYAACLASLICVSYCANQQYLNIEAKLLRNENRPLHITMVFLGASNVITSSVITLNNFFRNVFSGTVYEVDFLVILSGANHLGSALITAYQSFAPDRYTLSYRRGILLSQVGILGMLVLYMFLPGIHSKFLLSAQGMMILAANMSFILGGFSGLFHSCLLSFTSILPEEFQRRKFIGLEPVDIGFSLIFVVSSAMLSIPTKRNSARITSENGGKIQAPENFTIITEDLIVQYFVLMGVGVGSTLISIALSYLNIRGRPKSHFACGLLDYDDQNHSTGSLFKVNILERHSIMFYVISMFLLRFFMGNACSFVYVNVAAFNPDPMSRFKMLVFIPFSYFLSNAFYHAGSLVVIYYSPRSMNGLYHIIGCLISAITLNILLVFCNFKRTGGTFTDDADPFPSAPRYITSDLAYFTILSINALVSGYGIGLIRADLSKANMDERIRTKFERLLLFSGHIATIISSFYSELLYYIFQSHIALSPSDK